MSDMPELPADYLRILRDPSVIIDADFEVMQLVGKWVLAQGEQVTEPMLLAPCARPGSPDDWWDEQHIFCTGSHHVGPGQVVLCSCPHHVPATWPGRKENSTRG